jgi:hypothetical protein
MLVRDVAIPGWGFLVLMEAQGFHYLVPIYIYIYIYICMHACISNVGMQVHGHEYNFFIPARKKLVG